MMDQIPKLPDPHFNKAAGFGWSRTVGEIVMDGETRFLKIQTHTEDERRLAVLLSKAMYATSVAEMEVDRMSEDDISKFLEDQSKHRFDAVTDMAG